jgi:hypothetical protein
MVHRTWGMQLIFLYQAEVILLMLLWRRTLVRHIVMLSFWLNRAIQVQVSDTTMCNRNPNAKDKKIIKQNSPPKSRKAGLI